MLSLIHILAEVTLSVAYRKKGENGEYYGGPMHYIKEGLGGGAGRFFGGFYAVALFILVVTDACFVQTNTLATSAPVSYTHLQLFKCREGQGLRPVGQRFCRARMDFNHQSVSACRNGCLGQGFHVCPYTCGVAWVHDDGKMALLAYYGNRADIQGIPGGCLIGADAALTQHDIGISL